jgi:hypothetical protein
MADVMKANNDDLGLVTLKRFFSLSKNGWDKISVDIGHQESILLIPILTKFENVLDPMSLKIY